MTISTLLIANRGEIAIRIARSAAELGIATVAIYSDDDARSLHVKVADRALPLDAIGPRAYLDIAKIVRLARESGCDAIHPGYGFLSENAQLAEACAEAGLTFVGPPPVVLKALGDKANARRLAAEHGVSILRGTPGKIDRQQAAEFLASLGEGGAMVLKAVAGGGGRGMRVVARAADIDEAWARCQSEAAGAFGNGELYAEELLSPARHIEVQVLGDRHGNLTHFGERECSLQRRHQKLVEIAPSPAVAPPLRKRLIDAALDLAAAVGLESLGTFEFLVAADSQAEPKFAFIESNPRLQVEHTVTEVVYGVDLVRAQLEVAIGRKLSDLGYAIRPAGGAARKPAVARSDDVPDGPMPRGMAIEMRVNLESIAADGAARPSSGTLSAFQPPSGAGIRVDTAGYVGYAPSANFDSLLAKLIVHAQTDCYQQLVAKAYRAACEFQVAGAATNLPFLRNLLALPEVQANDVHTRFVESSLSRLVAGDDGQHAQRYFAQTNRETTSDVPGMPSDAADTESASLGLLAVSAPMRGTVVAWSVAEGQVVRAGQTVAVLEAMKMEHVVAAPAAGVVRRVLAAVGQTVAEAQTLALLDAVESDDTLQAADDRPPPEQIRADLAEVQQRHWFGTDEARAEAVAKRHARGQRTARENIADLVDPGSFIEYGALAVAAQRSRRSEDDLIRNTSGDAMIVGIGAVNGQLFDPERARCLLLIGDYMVLAGTQGYFHHSKLDRAVELAERWKLPVIVLPEGGGGRPGDTDKPGVSGLTTRTFGKFARLSGVVPIVSLVSGWCFAGSAVLAGCSDVVIATRNSSLGMAGPAMIEGGGLGVFAPADVGPIGVQSANGVVDVVVADEAEGCRVAKQYLSYFQGATTGWTCEDQRLLRHLVPENRIRAYDVRTVIHTLADAGSVLELRREWGRGMITALVRIEGRPLGLLANNPRHLGGAIDSDASDKAARFMQLCNAFGLPLVSLCDTPGFMVGPDAERTALVRHTSRMFVTGASLEVPLLMVVLRKAYGLGAQAMAGGSFREPAFGVAWPSGECGPMGLEGAVRLGFRKELEAVADPAARQAKYDELVAHMYRRGKALNVASYFELDAVIDPADTRHWITRTLASMPAASRASGQKFR